MVEFDSASRRLAWVLCGDSIGFDDSAGVSAPVSEMAEPTSLSQLSGFWLEEPMIIDADDSWVGLGDTDRIGTIGK